MPARVYDFAFRTVWAHVGGFLTRFVIVLLLRPLIPRRPGFQRQRKRREML